MTLSFSLNHKTAGPYYVGYAPVLCSLKISAGKVGPAPVSVHLSNNAATGGQLVFYTSLSAAGSSALNLQVPGDGKEVTFYIGGKYMAPSIEDGDAGINFSVNGKSALVARLMVRVRKDANKLTPAERDRFLSAYVKLVTTGKYDNFLAMHNEAADGEIHGRASFLAWHRIYVLDLERHLQEIDASVSLPYWNFQFKAEKVFTAEFMGVAANTPVGRVQFSDLNPLNNWRISGVSRLARKPYGNFDPLHDKANVENQSVTLGRGPGYFNFRKMEGNPHGSAHVSWTGPIDNPPTAPQDPLFFMLHCNVDRLWATWQMQDASNNLFKSANPNAYKPDSFPTQAAPRIGDFLPDTMWPWNGVSGAPRPATAPGGPLIASPFTAYPGKKPIVADTIDYQGRVTGHSLYFDYDSLAYTFVQPAQHAAALALTDAEAHLESHNHLLSLESTQNQLFSTQFVNANNSAQAVQALSNLHMLPDDESISKAFSILKDASFSAGERVLALSRLTADIGTNQDEIKYVLDLIADQATSPELRRAAFRAMKNLSFSSPLFSVMKPAIVEVFRGLIHEPNQEIRVEAISYLAKNKDEVVQRELLNGLEHPEAALIPEELAIHLLGFDIHAGIFPVLRDIVDKSSNLESRAEAIHLLAGDPAAKELLLKTFNNKAERFDIRKSSLLALKEQNPQEFLKLAQQTVVDNDENENIRAVSINALQHTDLKPTKQTDDFVKTLKGLTSTLVSTALAAGISAFLKHNENEGSKQ